MLVSPVPQTRNIDLLKTYITQILIICLNAYGISGGDNEGGSDGRLNPHATVIWKYGNVSWHLFEWTGSYIQERWQLIWFSNLWRFRWWHKGGSDGRVHPRLCGRQLAMRLFTHGSTPTERIHPKVQPSAFRFGTWIFSYFYDLCFTRLRSAGIFLYNILYFIKHILVTTILSSLVFLNMQVAISILT